MEVAAAKAMELDWTESGLGCSLMAFFFYPTVTVYFLLDNYRVIIRRLWKLNCSIRIPSPLCGRFLAPFSVHTYIHKQTKHQKLLREQVHFLEDCLMLSYKQYFFLIFPFIDSAPMTFCLIVIICSVLNVPTNASGQFKRSW